MKRSPDNQINVFSHWHLENYGRRSSAQLDRWYAPMQRPIIDQCPVEQTAYRREIKDNGYKSVKFLAGTSKEQVLDKGIRQKSKKSELVHCLQCLLSGATEPWPHGLRETIACIQVKRHDGVATRVDKAPAKPPKNRNARLDALQTAVPKKKLYGLRCELVKVANDNGQTHKICIFLVYS